MAALRPLRRFTAVSLVVLLALGLSAAFPPARAAATDHAGLTTADGAAVPPASAVKAAAGSVVAVVRGPDGSLRVEHPMSAASDDRDVAAQVAHLRARPDVVAADVDVATTALGTVAQQQDPLRGHQWPLDTLEASSAWAAATGTGVTVAVLDTGVQADHPDLRGRVLRGTDFTGTGRDGRTDVKGHGTHVAGIIAAGRGNGVGTVGLSHGAEILPVQVLGDDGGGRMSWAAEGIIWATDNGADVVNMSLGATRGSAVLDAAVDYALDHGVTLVASSGNAGGDAAMWPAAHDDVISVGATTSTDTVPAFSNTDPALDVVAPGASVASTCVTSRWCLMTGTSMAAPHVAAAAAALVEAAGDPSPAEIAEALRRTAVDLGPRGHDPASGHGRIDLVAALAAVDGGAGAGGDDAGAGGSFAAAGSGLRHVADTVDVGAASVAASRASFADRAQVAVVARDDVFADSLTGAVLAGERGPVLFTPGGSDAPLGAEAAAELSRVLAPGATVYVLGGAAAVSDRAVADIAALGLRPRRVAGDDRVRTAAAVADLVAGDTTTVERVLLARADHWADAVTASAYAAASGTPTLLTPSDRLAPATAAWLDRHDVQEVVVLGGRAAVSEAVAEQVAALVGGVDRVGGADRAATAARVAQRLWSRADAAAGDEFVVVEGYNDDSWAPAIAAAVLSALRDAPQLLVRPDHVPDGTRTYLEALSYDAARPASATAVGGRVESGAGRDLLGLIGRT